MDNNTDFYKSKVLEISQNLKTKKLKQRGIVLHETEPIYVIYVRRSTKRPKNKSDDKKDKQERSIGDQIKACKTFAKQHSLKWVDIEEEEESAHKSNKRETFSKILNNIKKGSRYNSILAWHPDRLARNMKDSGIIMDMVDAGVIVDLQFPAFTFTNDPSGKMALGIQFVLAKNYSDGLSVTTGRGIDGKAEEGKYMGKAKHGYSPNKDDYFRPNKDFQEVQRIWQEAMNGKTSRELESYSEKIGYHMHYKAILSMLHDPFYTGVHIYGVNIADLTAVDSGFVPMVNFKEFIEVDRLISSKKAFDYSGNIKNILFKKMVTCGYCNHTMSPYKAKKLYYTIQCSSKLCKSKDNGIKRGVRGKIILEYIIDLFETHFKIAKKDYKEIVKGYSKTREEQILLERKTLKTLNGKMNKLSKEIDGLSLSLHRAKKGAIDSITDRITRKSEELEDEQHRYKELEEELINIESKINETVMSYEDFSNFFKKARGIIESTDNMYLLDQLIRNVFSNFIVEDAKVIGHRLKEPFNTYEKMSGYYGVEDGT